jgi:hypothetical protein
MLQGTEGRELRSIYQYDPLFAGSAFISFKDHVYDRAIYAGGGWEAGESENF